MTLGERHLDVRGLPPCEPLERVLEALEALPTTETLVVAIHREPFPLYELLPKLRCAASTTALPDGTYEVRITRRP